MDAEKTVNNKNVDQMVSDKDLAEIKSAMKEIAGDLTTLFSTMLKRVSGNETQKSLEQIGKYYEKACDLLIIDAQKNESLNYISGKLNIEITDDIHFICSTELYFQDANEQWKVKKVSSGQMLMRTHLTLDALNELKQCKKVSFEVLDPEVS
jgi:hypothetical protein